MDFKKICYNCMKEKNSASDNCPFCGYDNASCRQKESQLPPLTPLNGKYILGRTLGRGGFGITYIALDTHLQVVVAIKELYLKNISMRDQSASVCVNAKDRSCFEDSKKRFLQEARILAMFNEKENEGIVIVKDHFEENNTAYIVMEYLDGETLKNKIRKTPMSYEAAKTMLLPVYHALMKIHQYGVVHLDVSPDNIIVQKNVQATLLDFGGAKSLYTRDEYEAVSFKRGYAPPEQYLKNGRIGQWTDVYGAAATLYFCITGKKPVDAMDRRAGIAMARPSELGIKLPSAAENAIMKAMEPDPGKRYQSVEEFWDALDIKRTKRGIAAALFGGTAAVLLGAVLILTGVISHKTESKSNKAAEDPVTVVKEEETFADAAEDTLETLSLAPGTYIFENAADRNMIMGVDSGFGDNGAKLILTEYLDANKNRFSVSQEDAHNESYILRASHTNSFIETFAGNSLNSPVFQNESAAESEAAGWIFVSCGYDDDKDMEEVMIQNEAGLVMAPSDKSTFSGTQIVMTERNMEDDTQKWYVRWSERDDQEPDAAVRHDGDMIEDIAGIKTVGSGIDGNLKFAISRDELFVVPTLIVWENVWDITQQFEFVPTGESRYKIFPLDQLEGEHKCLEHQPDTNAVIMCDESENKNQLFRIIYAGYNMYLIQSYNESVLGFDKAEDGSINGRAVFSRPYDSLEDNRLEKWLIEDPLDSVVYE